MINAELLISSMDSIIDYLKKLNLEKIELIDDLYLELADEKFDVYSKTADELKSAEVCIGSVFDDVYELKRDIEKDCNGLDSVSVVTIERLAHILEYISFYIKKEKMQL